ncbi:hypothetical protein [Nocardia sp. NPDC050710]|uniref:hypothetical protein n=1 Tax=Nocardia sp. NPDC050710 TaxID=3157220 RepID=UPI0033D0CCA0
MTSEPAEGTNAQVPSASAMTRHFLERAGFTDALRSAGIERPEHADAPHAGPERHDPTPDPDVLDITGLEPSHVLAALYNSARLQGRGISDPRGSLQLTVEAARELLHGQGAFGYLHGRVLKLDFRERAGALNVRHYNRDNGAGHAQRVVEHLRATGSIDEIRPS